MADKKTNRANASVETDLFISSTLLPTPGSILPGAAIFIEFVPRRDQRPKGNAMTLDRRGKIGFPTGKLDAGTILCPERKCVGMKHLRVIIIMVAALSLVTCAKPPQAAIDAARAAVQTAADNSDVLTYAPDSLRAAQQKMDALNAELAAQERRSPLSRSYDGAARFAQEAVTAAQQAGTDAQNSKQQVAKDAAALIEKVGSEIPDFEAMVWTAKRVRGIRMDAITPLALVADQARLALDDARKDLDTGAFAAAKAKAMAVEDWLSQGEETITEQTRVAKNR